MGDKKDIPEWQKQPDDDHTEPDAQDVPTDAVPSSQDESNRQELLAQARTFLAHDEIKHATTESKISFLEEKGLTNGEIHELLGISRNDAAAPEPAADVMEHSQQQAASARSLIASESTSSPPPIITYPEFLLHASKPPPLITPTRVLNAIYAGSVVGATIYGASKFILQPMFDSLSEARHDFFVSTKEQLQPLNEKLETVVSHIPSAARVSNIGHERRVASDREDLDDEDSSVASDPTETFNRDIGVQTSPLDSPELDAAVIDKSSISATAEKLSALRGHLNVLLHSSSTSLNATEKAKSELKDTEVYLDQLRYGSGGTGYSALSGDEGWRNQIFGSKVAGSNKKVDAVEEFKTDIRAMKGTLLSARNFPRGGERMVR